MPHLDLFTSKATRFWSMLVIQSVIVAIVVLALSTLTIVILRVYFNNPPIQITSLDPPYLGVLCPGDEVYIHNHVHVNEPILMFYYVSTLDVTGSSNVPGTQRAFTDYLHPRIAEFDQVLPWTVPNIEPGRYRRVFASRNVERNQRTIFIEATYEVGEGEVCNGKRQNVKR